MPVFLPDCNPRCVYVKQSSSIGFGQAKLPGSLDEQRPGTFTSNLVSFDDDFGIDVRVRKQKRKHIIIMPYQPTNQICKITRFEKPVELLASNASSADPGILTSSQTYQVLSDAKKGARYLYQAPLPRLCLCLSSDKPRGLFGVRRL